MQLERGGLHPECATKKKKGRVSIIVKVKGKPGKNERKERNARLGNRSTRKDKNGHGRDKKRQS